MPGAQVDPAALWAGRLRYTESDRTVHSVAPNHRRTRGVSANPASKRVGSHRPAGGD